MEISSAEAPPSGGHPEFIEHRIVTVGTLILEIPISSLSEEYKCAKVRLEMMLMVSRDPFVAQASPRLTTGMKWAPAVASKQVEEINPQ